MLTNNSLVKFDDNLDLDLIANLVAAAAGLIPYVGSFLKPIISYILHSVFGKNGDQLFIDIIDQKIAAYANQTAIGEFRAFLETAKLLEISMKQWKETGKVPSELIARNEICLNHSLRIIDIFLAVAQNPTNLVAVQPIISMASFMNFGLLLESINHGKEWGYSTIDGFQQQLELKSDEVFRFLTKQSPDGSYPLVESANRAQRSLLYFRAGYNNLGSSVRMNIANVSDPQLNPPLQKNQCNLIVGTAFAPYATIDGYQAVAYDFPATVSEYQWPSIISHTLPVQSNSSGNLQIKVLHACVGFDPIGTSFEVFFNNQSQGKMKLFPPYWEDQHIAEVFHQGGGGSNYQDIRLTNFINETLSLSSSVSEIKFEFTNSEFDCIPMIYQVEATLY